VRQAERNLQREVVVRLTFAPLAAIVVGSSNGVYLPARTPVERVLAARLVARLKADGSLTPGAPDLIFLWGGGCGCIELKRPEEKRLFDRARAGRLSDAQVQFQARCVMHAVRYAVCDSWPSVRDTLMSWGRLPADWVDPDNRVGAAA
jgi:hypothetical protein